MRLKVKSGSDLPVCTFQPTNVVTLPWRSESRDQNLSQEAFGKAFAVG